jgi:alkylhydroperoxidase/carboxymuconolactone decarboxylase family protein YurZ
MKALVQIALSVAESGKSVQPNQVTQARSSGASDREIHDTVLIAAAFCMYNRYVDGMQTFADLDDKEYSGMGQSINQKGYLVAA